MDKIYNAVILLLLTATVLMASLFYLKWIAVREENIERRLDESRLVYRIDALEREKAYKQEYYYRLLHDDAFAERVIREKLGFVGRDEIVFRFKDSTPVSVDTNFAPRFFPKQTDVKKQLEPVAQTLSEEETAPAEPQRKSILRRLFSRPSDIAAERATGGRADGEPAIKIDMSAGGASGARASSAQAEVPKVQESRRAADWRENPIRLETSPEPAKARENSKTSARKKSSPNAIRFRAD